MIKRWKAPTVAVGMAGLLSLTAIAAIGAPAQGAATPKRVALAGSEVAAVARQHPVGAVSKASRISFELVLQLRDEAGAAALVKAVSTPGSASFRHYVTRAEWEARFSPTSGEVRQARAWLRTEGFAVRAVSKDRLTISASGTARQVEQAFGTGLEYYRVGGHILRYATSSLSVPASIAASVVGAMGVNEDIATPAVSSTGPAAASNRATVAGSAKFPPAPSAFVTAPPCGAYYGAKTTTLSPPFGNGYPKTVSDEVCGYLGTQFRSAYKVPSVDTGKGVTVAIIDAYGSATIGSDATKFFNTEDPSEPFATADFAQRDAFPFNDESTCAPDSWLVEQDLDVVAVHNMAPDAHILFVGAQNCENGLFKAEQDVIDNGLANVVTNSWADTDGDLLDDPATHTAYDDLFMLADATGMTVQFSSGDDGDDFVLTGISAANYPTSSPYVTGVGGTSLEIGSTGQRIDELGWAVGRAFFCSANVVNILCDKSSVGQWLPASFDGGSGGFTSFYYRQPYYQANVVPSLLALRNESVVGPEPYRVVPDISMDADPSTGQLMGLHETFPNGQVKYATTRYGGTSLASPLLAGIVADVDQAAGVSVGFINPTIYRLASTPGAIYDVLSQPHVGMYRVDHGYTLVPGLGGTIQSFRELEYTGTVTYCDETGNCESRPMTQTAAKGYDSLTGLGSAGPGFVGDLAKA